MSDQQVQDILSMKQLWHPSQGLQTVHFQSIKTESGVFSLWEISLGPESADKRIIPLFVNQEKIYRPVASRLTWEELLKPECRIEVGQPESCTDESWQHMETQAQELATDAFIQLKEAYEQRHEQEYRKKQRALTLRLEAAQRIGIDNIRKARIEKLEAALQKETDHYARTQEICPTFSPVIAFVTR